MHLAALLLLSVRCVTHFYVLESYSTIWNQWRIRQQKTVPEL